MKKLISSIGILSLALGFLAAGPASASTSWNIVGSHVIELTCTSGCAGTFAHTMNVSAENPLTGDFSGTGFYNVGGTPTWTVTGNVSGSNLTFHIAYDASSYVLDGVGVISPTGTMSGTATGPGQTFDWTITSGDATVIAPAAFSVDPWIYDPDGTDTAVAEWQVVSTNTTYPTDKKVCMKNGWKDSAFIPAFRNQGQCVSYVANLGYVLSLQKNGPTVTNSAGGATLVGTDGLILTELGFDYKGYCGAGAPRFNVYTSGDTYYFFGCTYGTHTDLGDGWTRVRFNNADASPSDGVTAFPGFGNITIAGIELVQDEGPAKVLLDNIDVNGTLVGGP